MKCMEALPRLGAYLDGALDCEVAQTLEEHLRDCPACQEAMLEEGQFLALLDDPAWLSLDPLTPLPDDFTARVVARVRTERGSGWNLLWPWLRNGWHLNQYAGLVYAFCTTTVAYVGCFVVLHWERQTGILSSLGFDTHLRLLDLQAKADLWGNWLAQHAPSILNLHR